MPSDFSVESEKVALSLVLSASNNTRSANAPALITPLSFKPMFVADSSVILYIILSRDPMPSSPRYLEITLGKVPQPLGCEHTNSPSLVTLL